MGHGKHSKTNRISIILPIIHTSKFGKFVVISPPFLHYDFKFFLDEIFHQDQCPHRHKKIVDFCSRVGSPEARVEQRCNVRGICGVSDVYEIETCLYVIHSFHGLTFDVLPTFASFLSQIESV